MQVGGLPQDEWREDEAVGDVRHHDDRQDDQQEGRRPGQDGHQRHRDSSDIGPQHRDEVGHAHDHAEDQPEPHADEEQADGGDASHHGRDDQAGPDVAGNDAANLVQRRLELVPAGRRDHPDEPLRCLREGEQEQESQEATQDEHDPGVGQLEPGRGQGVERLRGASGMLLQPSRDGGAGPVQKRVGGSGQPVEQAPALANQAGRQGRERLALADQDRDGQIHQNGRQHHGAGEHEGGGEAAGQPQPGQATDQRVQHEHDHRRDDQVGKDGGQAAQDPAQHEQQDGRSDARPRHDAPTNQAPHAPARGHQPFEVVADRRLVLVALHGFSVPRPGRS